MEAILFYGLVCTIVGLVRYYAVSSVDDFPRRCVFSLELVPWDSKGANIRWLSIQLRPGDLSLLYNTALPCCRRIARQAIERNMELLQEHSSVFLYWGTISTDWATKSLGTRSFGNTTRFLVTPATARRRRCVALGFGTSSRLDFGIRGGRVKAQSPYTSDRPPQFVETILHISVRQWIHGMRHQHPGVDQLLRARKMVESP